MRLPCIRTLVLPKVHSAQDLHHVSEEVYMAYRAHKSRSTDEPPVQLVASIESAKAMHNLGEIASWQSTWGAAQGGKLSALLVRAFLRAFTVLRSDIHTITWRLVCCGRLYVRSRSECQGLADIAADCADTGIIRTTSRQELLYTRSNIVVTAKAFGLGAIDMVRLVLILAACSFDLVLTTATGAGLRELQGLRLPPQRMRGWATARVYREGGAQT